MKLVKTLDLRVHKYLAVVQYHRNLQVTFHPLCFSSSVFRFFALNLVFPSQELQSCNLQDRACSSLCLAVANPNPSRLAYLLNFWSISSSMSAVLLCHYPVQDIWLWMIVSKIIWYSKARYLKGRTFDVVFVLPKMLL